MRPRLIPSKLRPGDTIGIAAPASPFDPLKLERGIHILREMGFSVVTSDLIFEKTGYLAGSDRQRAAHLNRLFTDDAVDAVMCARGGYGSLRLLEFIDFETVARHPKLFVGFSDLSVLLSSFYCRCGLITVHGPVVTTLETGVGTGGDMLRSLLYSGEPPVIYPEKGITIKSGRVTAPVIGGNLATLNHLMGTGFEPDFSGHIVFLEDIGESLYKIDRMLTQMKLAGCFEKIAGLVLGSFENCGDEEDIHVLIDRIFHHVNVPILAGLGIGHGKNNGVLPLGLKATLDAGRQMLSYCETLSA